MALFAELKRRKVVQVAIAYVIAAWVLIEVVSTVQEPLNLPPWFDTAVIVVAIAGLPLALVFSWVYDLTAQGVVRTPARDGDADTQSQSATVSKQAIPAARELLPNSVAVLPLENLSPNPNDAFFAAGIHEEILNYLAKIKDLNVIARTSVKRYAGTDQPISVIGRELGVATIMEGSVRYAGDRVRIATQLIETTTEKHLWSEVYERDLSDVFAIQADVARNVAESLRAQFSVADQKSLDELPTTASPKALSLFLESQAQVSQGDAIFVTCPPAVRAQIHNKLDQAIAADPDFAPSYAIKALLYAISRVYDPVDKRDWLERAAELDDLVTRNAERALVLSPVLKIPHLALALNHQFNWRGEQAAKAYHRVYELGPNDATMLYWYAGFKWLARELDAAIEYAQRAVKLDPANILASTFLGLILHTAGRDQESLDVFARAIGLHPGSPHIQLHAAIPLVALGKKSEALERLRLADQLMPDAAAPAIHVHLAYGLHRVGAQAESEKALSRLDRVIGQRFADPMLLAWAMLARGDREVALAQFQEALNHPELRHEPFGRGFIKENAWGDPDFERAEFAAVREKIELIN